MAKPHGPGAAALYHTEQGKHMGKKEKSALCQEGQIHAASVQIQQPNAEAAAEPFAQLGPWAQLVPGQTGSKRKE